MTMLYRDWVNTIANAMILTSALLLVTACGGQSAAPAQDDATATATAATIAAAVTTPQRSDDEVATAVAATLTAAAPPAITLPSPTPTLPPPGATAAATPVAVPPTSTPVPATPASTTPSLATPNVQVIDPSQGWQVIERNGGSLDGSEVWQGGNLYVLTSDLSITDRGQLTIEPGVIIKVARGVRIYVSGSLQVNGNADNGVIFTSLADDEFGGDTDNNGDMVLPSPGDWNGLYFYSTNNSNKSVVSDAEVRYTQTAYTLADGATPTIERAVVAP